MVRAEANFEMIPRTLNEPVPAEAPAAGGPPPRCQPPAQIDREVRSYDQAARVAHWSGPRYRMVYRELGEGPPLIWVPGIASTYRTYVLVLNRLARRFRTIQYTYPGDEPGDGACLRSIGHEHLVDDLLGLLDHLGAEQAFLAGLSFGSTIALMALHRQGQGRRFTRTVVQGAFAHRRFTVPERLALALGRRLSGPASRLPLREWILTCNSRMDFPGIIEDRWPFYLEQNGQTPIRALAHRAGLVARLDLRPYLAGIEAPLLLVQGNEDRIVPRRDFEILKAGLPRSESVIMPTVGHVPHLTHAESLARLLGDWFLPCPPEQCSSLAAEGGCGGVRGASCAGEGFPGGCGAPHQPPADPEAGA